MKKLVNSILFAFLFTFGFSGAVLANTASAGSSAYGSVDKGSVHVSGSSAATSDKHGSSAASAANVNGSGDKVYGQTHTGTSTTYKNNHVKTGASGYSGAYGGVKHGTLSVGSASGSGSDRHGSSTANVYGGSASGTGGYVGGYANGSTYKK
jgi:hypothetical protein